MASPALTWNPATCARSRSSSASSWTAAPLRTPAALHYVPGGHHRMADYFAADWALGQLAQTPDDIDAQNGTAFIAEPGDVIVMHHLVPHRVGINTSSTPRVMAYFRVHHAQHTDLALRALSDPWLEYPALAAPARPGTA